MRSMFVILLTSIALMELAVLAIAYKLFFEKADIEAGNSQR